MVTIPGQFNGPLRSGNGGWVCGLMAAEWVRRNGPTVVAATLIQPPPLDSTLTWEEDDEAAEWVRRNGPTVVAATLIQPPPLDSTLTWEEDDEAAELRLLTAGGAVIGTATPGAFADAPPPTVSRADADAGEAAYPGHHHHPFDHCFTCGTARDPGDGLRIFTGPIAEGRTAGPWDVHPAFADDDGHLPTPVAWAGLDCPGGWAGGFPDDVILLGRMTAEVIRPPRPGEALLATGWQRARDGRKRLTSTALYTDDGSLVGRSEQVWIAVSTD